MSRVEHIGRATLYLGDCRDILPTLAPHDAVITDPPYGIGADKGAGKSADKWTAFTGERTWDDATPTPTDFAKILAAAKHAIIWGGNYFPLPPSPCWLIWDKETAGVTTFADCEAAWTNLPGAMRLIRHLWSGPYMKTKEVRYHPTQKPMAVMDWCVSRLPESVGSVLDPYMGSGTTGCAVVRTHKTFTGIERDERFFDIACRRIEDAQRQGDMFLETAA